MLEIVRHQIIEGLRDARFIFIALLVLVAFAANGFIYAERSRSAMEDWSEAVADTTRMLATRAGNLQEISSYPQRMVKHPSALAFIADGGEERIPNTLLVNAFRHRTESLANRGNEMFPIIPVVDWVFIIGTVMTLLALLLSFGSICGEKRDGTLRQMLSYPVSRMKIFVGKYLGLLFVLTITLLVGIAVSISIMFLSGTLPLTERVITAVGWAVIISILCLSFFLLSGIAVSSLVQRPAVALVILMIFWLVCIIAIPGLARLLGENAVSVPTSFDVDRESSAKGDEIWVSAPDRTFNWSSAPEYRFTEDAQNRATYVKLYADEMQRISDRATSAWIRQAEFIQTVSCASPAGLLGDALQRLSGTGISGYKAFRRNARRYNQQLYAFAVQRDSLDPDTPHNVYSWGVSIDEGTFSTRPVELSSFPRYHTLWLEGGLPEEQDWPLIHILLFLAGNLQMAILAFIALARYDPR